MVGIGRDPSAYISPGDEDSPPVGVQKDAREWYGQGLVPPGLDGVPELPVRHGGGHGRGDRGGVDRGELRRQPHRGVEVPPAILQIRPDPRGFLRLPAQRHQRHRPVQQERGHEDADGGRQPGVRRRGVQQVLPVAVQPRQDPG